MTKSDSQSNSPEDRLPIDELERRLARLRHEYMPPKPTEADLTSFLKLQKVGDPQSDSPAGSGTDEAIMITSGRSFSGSTLVVDVPDTDAATLIISAYSILERFRHKLMEAESPVASLPEIHAFIRHVEAQQISTMLPNYGEFLKTVARIEASSANVPAK